MTSVSWEEGVSHRIVATLPRSDVSRRSQTFPFIRSQAAPERVGDPAPSLSRFTRLPPDSICRTAVAPGRAPTQRERSAGISRGQTRRNVAGNVIAGEDGAASRLASTARHSQGKDFTLFCLRDMLTLRRPRRRLSVRIKCWEFPEFPPPFPPFVRSCHRSVGFPNTAQGD